MNISPLIRIFLSLSGLFAAVVGIVFLGSFQVSAGNSTCRTYIDPTISVSPNNLPFGKVFPEEVLYKEVKVGLSNTCINEKKIESVSYSIVQTSKGRKSKDDNYCASHPNDLVKCYPSLCPYLSKTPDASPVNDVGVPAFHDPMASSSTALGTLLAKTDKEDKWVIDLHVPCFKGECAQDHVIPKDYEMDPAFAGKELGCNLNISITHTTEAFKEKEGTIGFWKNWNNHKTYTQAQINGWLSTINTDSGWMLSEVGYSVNTSGLVSLINDSNGCNGSLRSCAKLKFLAQYLSARLNVLSGRKLLTNTYNFTAQQNSYLGTSNAVPLSAAFTATEAKLPDNGTNPTRAQFLLMAGAYDTVNNQGF